MSNSYELTCALFVKHWVQGAIARDTVISASPYCQSESVCGPPRAAIPACMDAMNAGLIIMGAPRYVRSTRHRMVCWYPVANSTMVRAMLCTFRPWSMSVLPMLLVMSAVSVLACGSDATCDPEKYSSDTVK